jgi:hypothetical protein
MRENAMRYPVPAGKTLKQIRWLSDKQIRKIRRLIAMKDRTTDYRRVADWVRQCYHRPSYLERLLCALDEICETFGVEHIQDNDNTLIYYLNTGQTYTSTLIFRRDLNRFQVSSFGDFIEWWECKHKRELR